MADTVRLSTTSAALSEQEQKAARERLQQHFGAVNLGYPTGTDNESIDTDLAREYDSTHE